MTFEQALREWGARKLEAKYGGAVVRASVVVDQQAEITFSGGEYTGDTHGIVMTIQGGGRTLDVDLDYGYDFGALIRDLDAIASEVPA